MARIFPFRAYRYSAAAGAPANLITQPYDKITPEMQERYFSLSPHNLAHVIRGRSGPGDTETDNVYTRAAGLLESWIASGILAREPAPALFAYFQKFEPPDVAGAWPCLRKGLIALGAVEDYWEGTVYRHELTHSGPKRDRLELLRRARAHCGQIFMLYDDPSLAVDQRLDRAAQKAPLTLLRDEYSVEHCLWRIDDPAEIAEIQRLIQPRKLLIADGHHRYETALAFRREHPELEGAARVMMTLVNTRSPGLVVLPTHRVLGNLAGFDGQQLLRQARKWFEVVDLASLDALQARLRGVPAGRMALGAIFRGDRRSYALEMDYQQADRMLPELAPAMRRLDVAVLHELVLARLIGMSAEDVRDERHLRYLRGFQAAAAEIDRPQTQAVFFLNPVRVEQVAEIAFSGGVMPQKSTDFYPKLLSGMTIYRLEQG